MQSVGIRISANVAGVHVHKTEAVKYCERIWVAQIVSPSTCDISLYYHLGQLIVYLWVRASIAALLDTYLDSFAKVLYAKIAPVAAWSTAGGARPRLLCLALDTPSVLSGIGDQRVSLGAAKDFSRFIHHSIAAPDVVIIPELIDP